MGRLGLLMVLFAYAAIRSIAYGAPPDPRLQVFIQVEGTVPDWVRMDLTIAKLEIGGIDPVTGKRFLVTAFSGPAPAVRLSMVFVARWRLAPAADASLQSPP